MLPDQHRASLFIQQRPIWSHLKRWVNNDHLCVVTDEWTNGYRQSRLLQYRTDKPFAEVFQHTLDIKQWSPMQCRQHLLEGFRREKVVVPPVVTESLISLSRGLPRALQVTANAVVMAIRDNPHIPSSRLLVQVLGELQKLHYNTSEAVISNGQQKLYRSFGYPQYGIFAGQYISSCFQQHAIAAAIVTTNDGDDWGLPAIFDKKAVIQIIRQAAIRDERRIMLAHDYYHRLSRKCPRLRHQEWRERSSRLESLYAGDRFSFTPEGRIIFKHLTLEQENAGMSALVDFLLTRDNFIEQLADGTIVYAQNGAWGQYLACKADPKRYLTRPSPRTNARPSTPRKYIHRHACLP